MLRQRVRRILILGVPLLAGNLSHYLMKIVDLAMLGRLGTGVLAAAGVGTLTAGVLYTMVWPVSLGVQALASRRFGRQTADGDGDDAARFTGRVLGNGIAVGWCATALALVLSLLLRPALSAILKDQQTAALATQYVHIIRWSAVLLSVGLAMRGFLGAINHTRIIMVATITGNVANVFFNWILIFGKLGLPSMGIRGAALGTVLAEALLTGVFLIYILVRASLRRYRVFRLKHVNRKAMGDIARVMIPPGVQNAAALAIFLSYQAIVERLGTDALAVTSLIFAVFRINKTIVGGFAHGTSIIVGNELGSDRKDEARGAMVAQEHVAAWIGVAVAAVLVFAPQTVLSLFALESHLLPLGVRALRFFAGFYFIEVMGYSFEIVFSHNGWGRLVLVSEFVTNVVFILGMTLMAVFVFDWGIYGAWSGFATYQIFHAAILYGGFLSGRWLSVQVE